MVNSPYSNGTWSEGKIVNGVNVGGGVFTSNPTPAPVVTNPTPTPTPTPTPVTNPTPTPVDRPIYDTPTAPTKTAEQIQTDMLQNAQGEINALGQYESSLLAEQKVINDKNDRSTASISTLTGLAGSTEANTQQQATTAVGQQANQKIKNEVAMKVQSLLGNIRASAVTEARSLREEARLTEQQRIANREKQQAESVTQLRNLAASGVTYDGLRNTDPNSFAYLSKQFGGDAVLKGAFVLNTPQDQIIDKKLENGKYIVARQNPLTGKVTVETTDIPGVGVGYSKVTDAGDRLIAIPDNWDGDTTKLRIINKGVDPSKAIGKGTTPDGTYIPGTNPTVDGWVSQINGGKAKISNVPKGIQGLVVQALSSTNNVSLSQAQINVQEASKLVKELIDAPGRESATGVPNMFTAPFGYTLPSSNARDFKAKIARLQSLLSLNAIQQMRGLGALSDAEGKRIENSVSAINEFGLPEQSYLDELNRIKGSLDGVKKEINSVSISSGDLEVDQMKSMGYTDEQIRQLKEIK